MEEELLRYFAVEARELVDGLMQAALQIERSGLMAPEQRRHLLRLAHTLKGAARVVKQTSIADAAHAVEDLVTAAGDQVDRSFGSRLLALLDQIATSLPADPAAAAAPVPTAAPVEDAGRSVRVELTAIETALERIADIGERCAGARRDLGGATTDMARVHHRVISSLDLLCDDVARLRGELHQMRLAPAGTLFVALERAVRDAALASDVRARFQGTGGEHRLEADVLTSVRDALIQLVRNAVAHGVEAPSLRAAAGKPAEGLVSLAIERRGADVSWTLSDDGRGLDLATLRQAALRSGLVASGSEPLSEDGVVELLLGGGLSSRANVSQISGRGVGLELVRTVVSRLGGRVSIRNRPGKGVAVELLLPVSMRSLSYLRLESTRGAALLPLEAVRRAARVDASSVVEVDGRPHLLVDNHPIPLVGLNGLLDHGHNGRPGEERFAAIVSAAGGSVAVAAERFGETATTIARALPPLSLAAPSIRAIALDDDGRIVPVLEPSMLRLVPSTHRVAARKPRIPRVLVVDDSITTRMLEQSILESAGFEVHTAASGEEALSRAATVQYDLYIVDLEMPLMNGFEFVAATRADPALAGTPCMLVTSRSSVEDRRRGLDAGARAYVVKGEFDQEVFLATVRGSLAEPITVLVAEDSMTVRRRIVGLLSQEPDLQVVGEAADGKQAIEMCLSLRPNVITLDMMMPEVSGLAATEYIMAFCPTPIVIVSGSVNRGEVFKTYEALAAGALDVIEKPHEGEAIDVWGRRLVDTVRVASRVKVITHPRARFKAREQESAATASPAASQGGRSMLVAIGASTGGPKAIVELLQTLPTRFEVPILVVTHISEAFSAGFVDWLSSQSPIAVRAAEHDVPIMAPGVTVAPAERHLAVLGDRVQLLDTPPRHFCRPSVDVLFESVAQHFGSRGVGILLTGMGRDGAAGLLAIRRAGGVTMAQDEASSVIFGMPGEAVRLGAAHHVLPPAAIGHMLRGVVGMNTGVRP